MADIAFECPHCHQALEAPEDMAGEVIECPACGKPLELPAAEGGGAAAGQTCPGCGADMAADAVLCVSCGYHLKLRRRIDTSFG